MSVSLSDQVFRDPRLSAAAKGVFGFIASHPDRHNISPALIAEHMRNGTTAIRTALRELEEHGYLTRAQTRKPDGKMGPRMYRLNGGDAR